MINAGVVGCGYWGPNLVRNFHESPQIKMKWACDLSEANLAKLRRRYPTLKTTTQYSDLLDDAELNLIAIATPVDTHYPLALKALKAGKNILVEKPLASNSAQAAELVQEAARRNLMLAVDHTFVFTSAVRKIKEIIDTGELGDICYYDSTRINLGLFQHDVNVLWDLAVHDLAILDFLLPFKPAAVSATGISHTGNQIENTAFMTLFYDIPFIAHINVNWMSPVKVRQTLISGTKKMIVYNDLEPAEKIKIYDKGITISNTPDEIHKLKVGYRSGDMLAPNIDGTEALRDEIAHLADCVERVARPLVGGETGLRIVRILEAATQSMKLKGEMVELNTTCSYT